MNIKDYLSFEYNTSSLAQDEFKNGIDMLDDEDYNSYLLRCIAINLRNIDETLLRMYNDRGGI